MASLLVQTYPAVPDALAVASAVVADMTDKGEPLPDKVRRAVRAMLCVPCFVCCAVLCAPCFVCCDLCAVPCCACCAV